MLNFVLMLTHKTRSEGKCQKWKDVRNQYLKRWKRERKRQVVDQRLGEWSLSLARVKKKGGKREKEKKSSYATLSVWTRKERQAKTVEVREEGSKGRMDEGEKKSPLPRRQAEAT